MSCKVHTWPNTSGALTPNNSNTSQTDGSQSYQRGLCRWASEGMCKDREKVYASGFPFGISKVAVDFGSASTLTFDRRDVRGDQQICSKLLYK